MNKRRFFVIVVIISLYQFINSRMKKFLKNRLIDYVGSKSDFSAHFIMFETFPINNKTDNIKSSRGFFIVNEEGIYYIIGFLHQKINFIPFTSIKKVELTQRVGDISLSSRALYIHIKKDKKLYFFMPKSNTREVFNIIKKGLK